MLDMTRAASLTDKPVVGATASSASAHGYLPLAARSELLVSAQASWVEPFDPASPWPHAVASDAGASSSEASVVGASVSAAARATMAASVTASSLAGGFEAAATSDEEGGKLPDLLLLRLRPLRSTSLGATDEAESVRAALLGLSPLPHSRTSASGNGALWAAIVVPPAERELRGALLACAQGWRDRANTAAAAAVAAAAAAAAALPDKAEEVKVGKHAAGPSERAAAAGALPPALGTGLVRAATASAGFSSAWEDQLCVEAALHADAASCEAALAGLAAGGMVSAAFVAGEAGVPPLRAEIPALVVCGLASGAAAAFAAAYARSLDGGAIVVELGDALSGSVIEHVLRETTPLPSALVLVAPPHCDTRAQLLALDGLEVAGARIAVAGVVVVVALAAAAEASSVAAAVDALVTDARGVALAPGLTASLACATALVVLSVGAPSTATSAALAAAAAATAEDAAVLRIARRVAPLLLPVIRLPAATDGTVFLSRAVALRIAEDVPARWRSPRSAAFRRLVLAWSPGDAGAAAPRGGIAADSLLHVFVKDQEGAGGATLGGGGGGDGKEKEEEDEETLDVLRVESFVAASAAGAAAARVFLGLPFAVEAHALRLLLPRLVVQSIGRADAALLGLDGVRRLTSAVEAKADTGGRRALLDALPGLPVAVGDGVAVVSVWRAEGAVLLAQGEEEAEAGEAGEGKGSDDELLQYASVKATPRALVLRPLTTGARDLLRLGLHLTGPGSLAAEGVMASLLEQVRLLCRPLLPAPRYTVLGHAPDGAAALVGRIHAADAFLLPGSVASDGSGRFFVHGSAEALAAHPRAAQLGLLHALRRDALAGVWARVLDSCEAAMLVEEESGSAAVEWPRSEDRLALAAAETAAFSAAAALSCFVDGEVVPSLPKGGSWPLNLAARLPESATLPWWRAARRAHAWILGLYTASPADLAALAL